jgi:hypothetical protein
LLAGTKRILELFEDNEFEIFVIQGKNGYGKSAYANRLLAEVYSEDGIHSNWSVPLLKTKIGFHPMKVITRWERMRKRDKAYHWDDSGTWLSAMDHMDIFCRSVSKFLQTARTKFGCIMFTCIDKKDILAKIRHFKSAVIIDITKSGNIPGSSYKSRKYRRIATAYSYWENRSGKTGYEYQWEEPYTCYMPDSFYSWYNPIRQKYANMAIKDMKEKIKNKLDIMNLEKDSEI